MTIRRRPGVTSEPSGDTVVILHADGRTLTTLNPVGALVWKALDGERDTAALARDLVDEFDGVEIGDLKADIDAFITELAESDLVDFG